MPSLHELAQLGRQALLAFVAQLLAEFTALKARIAELLDQIATLSAEKAALNAENAALKARLDQSERAGHRQAAPFSRGRRKPDPKPPGRKPGQGRFSYRALPTPEQWTAPPIDVRLPEPVCPGCGAAPAEQRVDFAAITDIPPQPRPIVRPYRVWVDRCPGCRATVRASHPDLAADQDGATAHRLGPRVLAAAHATHDGLGVPVRKVPAILHLYTGVHLTQSALTQDALRRTEGPIGQAYQELCREIPRADVVYTEDTSGRVGGVPAYLMIFQTDTATVSQIRPQHRNEEVRERIGEAYAGVLVTDRGPSYDARELEGVKQRKCLFHALRSIAAALATKRGRARDFGERLKALLKAALELWQEYRDRKGRVPDFAERARHLRLELTWHLRRRVLSDADNQRLLNEFGRHHDRGNLVRFLEDPRIEPTNNRSERGLRFAVIQRKVSQCSKTGSGARAFAAMASVTKTLMRKGEDVVERLAAIFRDEEPRAAPN